MTTGTHAQTAVTPDLGRHRRARRDPFDGLRRIGIDEISYKRGHRYLMVVVDHDTGRLVWAGKGRTKDTLRQFFDELGKKRCNKIKLVSADAAEFIGDVVKWPFALVVGVECRARWSGAGGSVIATTSVSSSCTLCLFTTPQTDRWVVE